MAHEAPVPLQSRGAMRGFTLVELMVGLLLGLIVMAGVGSIFLAGQRVNRTSRALGDVQESLRMAFELLAHDIRNAGATGCVSRRLTSVLSTGVSNGSTIWWADWRNAIRGYDGDDPYVPAGKAAGDRVTGKPSLQLLGGKDTSFSVVSHDEPQARFALRETSADMAAGDVFIVCDYDHATIFRASVIGARTVGYVAAGDNCMAGQGYPASCESTHRYVFGANALLTPLSVSDWYIGINPDKGLSLYRLGLEGDTLKRQEMVRGVTDLQLTYHQDNLLAPFVRATEVSDWESVTAVRATFGLQSADQSAGVNEAPVSRQFSITTALRNRVQ